MVLVGDLNANYTMPVIRNAINRGYSHAQYIARVVTGGVLQAFDKVEYVDVDEIKSHLINIDGVIDVHHIHIWSLDGKNNCATMHVVTNSDNYEIKGKIRDELNEHGICHITIETETENDDCHETDCNINSMCKIGHHHHHH